MYKRQDKRVGLDCSNGSASSIAKSVFDALGAKTYVINSEPDGTNINRNCGSTHIEVLQQFVKEKNPVSYTHLIQTEIDRVLNGETLEDGVMTE